MGNPIFTNLIKFANLASIKKYATHVYEFDNVVVIERWKVGSHE